MGEHRAASAVDHDSELEQLRATARGAGASTEQRAGWFARVLQDRLARKGTEPRDWDAVYPRLSTADRANRRVAAACRKAAFGGGLSSAGAHAGAAAVLLTEGLTAAIGVPSVLAAVAADTLFSAVVQIDLACDLASIYGVPFLVSDAGELATVFDIALRGVEHETPARGFDASRLLAPNDAEMLARVGDHLAREAVLGLVPLAGIPYAVVEGYAATRDLGRSACDYVRARREAREVLGATLEDPDVDAALLLEGAWLLVTSDDVLTHEEAVLLAMLARKIPAARRAPLEHLRFIGEGVWIVHLSWLDDARCTATLSALEAVAALRGETTQAERRLLEGVGEAVGHRIDFARIEKLHRRVHGRRVR